MTSWIKLHRKFAKWGWTDKPEMVSLFVHLLIDANFEDRFWHGKMIKRGQVVFGRVQWSERLGISEQSLRTCIERLKSTNEILVEITSKFSIITIVNYNEYQSYDEESTSEPKEISTSNQPAINQQSTTPKELKNLRKKEEVSISPLRKPDKNYSEEFERFWVTFPKNGASKTETFKSYARSVDILNTPEMILQAIPDYVAYIMATNTPVCHATTWLNQRRWEVDYKSLTKGKTNENTSRTHTSNARPSKSEEFKRRLVEGTLDDIDQQRRSEEGSGKSSGTVL